MFLAKDIRDVGPYEFISSEPPGICSQRDFNHDVSVVMRHIDLFNMLVEDHDYKVKLTPEEAKSLREFVERAVKDSINPVFD